MAVIKLRIIVEELENTLSLFDAIQVQRSELGAPYTDAIYITDAVAQPAQVVGTAIGPYTGLQNKVLRLKFDGRQEQHVIFSYPDPLTLPRVIQAINSQIMDGRAEDDGAGHLRLTSLVVGTPSLVEILGGDALTVLGLSAGKSVGRDHNIILLPEVDEYAYDDQSGSTGYFYRSRYVKTGGGWSAWSDWELAPGATLIPPPLLIIGRIRLANLDGTALEGARITIANAWNPLLVESTVVAGQSLYLTTDGLGQAEVTLIRGSIVDVVLEGTSIVRRIQVPTVGTEFDLLDPALETGDAFGIQVPDLPAAPRTTL